jgi:hypothetical protein
VVGAGVAQGRIALGPMQFNPGMTEGFELGLAVFAFDVGGLDGASTAKTLRHRSSFLRGIEKILVEL